MKDHVGEGNIAISVGDYFSTMLDQNMNWDDAADLRAAWGGILPEGVMSADAHRAVYGADAIMVSNHGGRQWMAGARHLINWKILAEVGGEIEVICDGGIRRGTHILKAMALGATACSGGRLYLYALAAGGQAGAKTLSNLKSEIERDAKLMGVSCSAS